MEEGTSLTGLAFSESLKELTTCHKSRVSVGVAHHIHKFKAQRRSNILYRLLAMVGEECLFVSRY